MKHGAPYKPTSQGAIERFNQTIQNQLETAYNNSSDENPFVLSDQLQLILHLYNNEWRHSSSKRIPIALLNETNPYNLEEARLNTQKRVSNACKLIETKLDITVGDEVLIQEDIIYEKSSSIWYLRTDNTYGKKLEINYSIFGKVVSVRDDFVVVQIIQSMKFDKGILIMVKPDAIKKINPQFSQSINT